MRCGNTCDRSPTKRLRDSSDQASARWRILSQRSATIPGRATRASRGRGHRAGAYVRERQHHFRLRHRRPHPLPNNARRRRRKAPLKLLWRHQNPHSPQPIIAVPVILSRSEARRRILFEYPTRLVGAKRWAALTQQRRVLLSRDRSRSCHSELQRSATKNLLRTSHSGDLAHQSDSSSPSPPEGEGAGIALPLGMGGEGQRSRCSGPSPLVILSRSGAPKIPLRVPH